MSAALGGLWTAERIKRLRLLHSVGLSARAIAGRMGIGCDAVKIAIHELKLKPVVLHKPTSAYPDMARRLAALSKATDHAPSDLTAAGWFEDRRSNAIPSEV